MDEVTTRPRGARIAPADEKVREPKVEPKAETPPDDDNYHYKLDYELEAHGDKITELVFREPTGNDLVRYGSPIRLDLSMNESVMENQMVALANVPPSTIKKLKAKDWQTIAFELSARFFVPTFRAPSS
jgi:tail assembly chaperone E/41/14-like protein